MSPSFQGPSALDLLAEFNRTYLAFTGARRTELRAKLAACDGFGFGSGFAPGEYALLYDELRTLDSFQPALHRLITAFVAEALKPWQEMYTDVVVRDVHPLLFRTIK